MDADEVQWWHAGDDVPFFMPKVDVTTGVEKVLPPIWEVVVERHRTVVSPAPRTVGQWSMGAGTTRARLSDVNIQ